MLAGDEVAHAHDRGFGAVHQSDAAIGEGLGHHVIDRRVELAAEIADREAGEIIHPNIFPCGEGVRTGKQQGQPRGGDYQRLEFRHRDRAEHEADVQLAAAQLLD